MNNVKNVRAATLILATFFLASLPPNRAHAETLYALTVDNSLITFDSATPGTTINIGSIGGVRAGDSLVGIDFRPSLGANNGLLYTVGVNFTDNSARVYTIDTTTAATTVRATLSADPADVTIPTPFTGVSGTSFGFDFNPVPDRLRLVSDTGQNLRINVDNGLVQLDVPLAYQPGDPNFGEPLVDVAVAYANNFGGATTTMLRGIDISQDPDSLVLHTNPNGGTIQTVLNLPFNSVPDATSYDISGITGTGYFSVTPFGSSFSSLFSTGPGGVVLLGTIGSGQAIRGIAAPVGAPVPEPASLTLLGIGAILAGVKSRRERALKIVE